MYNGKYTISYLPIFLDDLEEIHDYISTELGNPIAAQGFINKIEKAIIKRAESPTGYEAYKSTIEHKDTYYRIYVDNYTVFYVLKGNIMEVRRLIYSRRDLKNTI